MLANVDGVLIVETLCYRQQDCISLAVLDHHVEVPHSLPLFRRLAILSVRRARKFAMTWYCFVYSTPFWIYALILYQGKKK